MKIRFFSYVDTPQIIKLFFSRSFTDEAYYFDISKAGTILLAKLRLSHRLKRFNFSLGEIRDARGESLFVRIFGEDLNDIYREIKKEICKENSLIEEYIRRFDKDKIESFFMKYFGRDLKNLVVFINIIDWYRNQKNENLTDTYEFSIARNSCLSILKRFAKNRYNIDLKAHFSFRPLSRALFKIFGNIFLSTVSMMSPIFHFRIKQTTIGIGEAISKDPLIAVHYSLLGLTFDVTKRSDFFWISYSDIPHEKCLVYFDRKDTPVTKEMVDVLKRSGVRYIALSKKAASTDAMPAYKPSIELTKQLFRLTTRTMFCMLKNILRLRINSFRCFSPSLHFDREYAKAFDFYRSMNIRINVDSTDFEIHHIPKCLALEKLGGISVSYQKSNMPIPQIPLSSFADVYFSFGSHYLPILRKNESKNHTIAICGYITDYAFRTVKEKSNYLRNSVLSKGANFIICYADENSSDDRMSLIPIKKGADIYKKLFELVIQDPTIGLICSPKRPRTLRPRLSMISQTIQQSEATGRAIILDGEYMASNYPTEAAQASDLAVTLLLGGTSYLETVLSGVRTICLDLEGLYAFDEYKWGKDLVIYDDLDQMIDAIKKYRNDPPAFKDFGNCKIIKTVWDKDPFRDGMAAERMGRYILFLFDNIRNGKPRQKTLEDARQVYAKEWGSGNVY